MKFLYNKERAREERGRERESRERKREYLCVGVSMGVQLAIKI